jgi:hypothetical protein
MGLHHKLVWEPMHTASVEGNRQVAKQVADLQLSSGHEEGRGRALETADIPDDMLESALSVWQAKFHFGHDKSKEIGITGSIF